MKRPKFDGCRGRNQARLPQGESCHRGPHQRTLVWLLASALAVFGTAEAKSAPHLKLAISPLLPGGKAHPGRKNKKTTEHAHANGAPFSILQPSNSNQDW